MFAYVGSRTTRERNARGEGISVYRCDEASGRIELVQVMGDLVNPSFLALNRAGTRLYAVHGDCESISAFHVSRDTGKISLLNQQSTHGKNPVHLALDASESFVIVSNHISSNLVVLPLGAEGELMPVSQEIVLSGEPGPHRKEQPHAKPHFNPFDPSGRFVIVPDKGLDKTFVFRFEAGKLMPCEPAAVLGREGSGPRHIAFHPSMPWAYIANELDSSVTACHFDGITGTLAPFQILSGLADTYTGNSRASEIAVDSAGRTLYLSNRGEDSIAVFRIDQVNGRLSLIQTQPALGRTPRFFALSPKEQWLYVLNEDSDSIVVFKRSVLSGILEATYQSCHCGSPVCMVFATA